MVTSGNSRHISYYISWNGITLAIILREKLGFPETAVYNFFDNGMRYAVAIVIESQNKELIQYRNEKSFTENKKLLDEWKQGYEIFKTNGIDFQTAMRTYPFI